MKKRMKGRIKKKINEKKFAFIEVKGQEGDVFLHLNYCINKEKDFERLEYGTEVEFDMVSDKKSGKKRAVNCRLVGAEGEKIGNVKEEDFINPYNFVRVSQPSKSDRTPVEVDHTQFHKGCYTGKMRFSLTNISPLFIPDTETKTGHKTKEKDKVHWSYKFFRINGTPAIPGTSLKGMIRSVYETITNSCFSQINREEEKINFRERAGRNTLKTGIVLSLPFDNNTPGKILRCEDAWAWVDKYFYSRYQNGEWIKFNVSNMYRKGFSFKQAKNVGKSSGKYEGYLKITGKDPKSNKHNERVFYHDCFTRISDLPEKSKYLWKKYEDLPEEDIFEFELAEKHKYDSIQKTQLDTGKAIRYDEKERKLDKTVYYNRGLSVGDLVYFKPVGNTAKQIANVAIPKSTFDENVYNLLKAYSEDLLPCDDVERLCPACKLFGATDLKEKDRNTAIAGRVKVGNAIIRDDIQKPKLTETTLKILGSPHETATTFYLIGEKYDNTTPILKETGKGYDSQNPKPILRGRKFYWHQCNESKGLNKSAYQTGEKSDQNATVELLEPGATFEFDIHFENLTEEELAYLIWCLELSPKLHHKLGHGKPLGLGSIKIKRDKEKSWLTDPDAYYLNIGSDGRKPFDFDKKPPFLKYRRNFADLIAILKPQEEMFSQIKYPAYVATSGKNTGKSLGFQWFVKFGEQQLNTISETAGGERQSGYTKDIKE